MRPEAELRCCAAGERVEARAASKIGPVLLAVLMWSALPFVRAAAQPVTDVQRAADNLGREITDAQRAGNVSAAGEIEFVNRLGTLVLTFIEQSDRAAQTGTERAKDLRPLFESLHAPLNSIYDRHRTRLDRMAREVMDADGDLEALYENREWKDSQRVAAEALYYLNWLNYYGARLYEGSRRKELLETAEQGFSEFAVGDRKTEILTESLLGRALCHLDLGNFEWAVRDFQIVIGQPGASPERKAKARIGRLEAMVRSGNTGETLRYSRELLASGTLSASELPLVRFFRLQGLFAASKNSSAPEAERHRREALALMQELRRAGQGWAEKVDALMLANVEDPGPWASKATTPLAKYQLATMLAQQGRYAEAAPLLEEVLASASEEVVPHRGDAGYLLGVARFNSGRYTEAAALLTEALKAHPQAAFAPDAAYLRFKALEALLAVDPLPETSEQYATALREFVTRYPTHGSVAEARHRLGEFLQAQGEFGPAVQEYRLVQGDPGLEVRALFGTLQCEFELLRQVRTRDEREALAEQIGGDLARFRERAAILRSKKNSDGLALAQFEAPVTLFEAAYLSLRGSAADAEIDALLADFPKRFPDRSDLMPQAVRMRLGALQRLGRFTEAEQFARTYRGVLRQDGRADLVENLAGAFLDAASRARRKHEGAAEAGAAEAVARILFEELPAEPPGQTKRRLTLARLYESAGDNKAAEAVYQDILHEDGNAPLALRGLARIAEQRGDLASAADFWKSLSDAARPGDRPWYEGHYQQARITARRGDTKSACERLENLRPAMPGLGDAELRAEINDFFARTCR